MYFFIFRSKENLLAAFSPIVTPTTHKAKMLPPMWMGSIRFAYRVCCQNGGNKDGVTILTPCCNTDGERLRPAVVVVTNTSG